MSTENTGKGHARFVCLVALILSIFTLSGCFGTVTRSSIPEQVDAAMVKIQPHKTSRNKVRELLGEPIISSDLWRVEVYRSDAGKNVGLLYFIVPIGAEDVVGYTLVVYDKNWVVKEYDYEIFVEDELEVSLYSRNFSFIAGKPLAGRYSETLIAADSLSEHESQATKSTGGCIINLLNRRGKGYSIHLDGDLLLEIPFISLGDVYYRTTIPSGSHELKLIAYTFTPRSFQSGFSCAQGEELYLSTKLYTIKHKDDSWSPFRNKMDISVDYSLPETQHDGYMRVIHHQGKWWSQY